MNELMWVNKFVHSFKDLSRVSVDMPEHHLFTWKCLAWIHGREGGLTEKCIDGWI